MPAEGGAKVSPGEVPEGGAKGSPGKVPEGGAKGPKKWAKILGAFILCGAFCGAFFVAGFFIERHLQRTSASSALSLISHNLTSSAPTPAPASSTESGPRLGTGLGTDVESVGESEPESEPALGFYRPNNASTTSSGRVAYMLAGGDIPHAVDWRLKQAVSSVKDQGSCKTCWAFAAIGAVEGALAILTNTSAVSLSPQQLISCDPHSNGCTPGGYWPQSSMDFVINQQFGAITSANLCPSVEANTNKCPNSISPSVFVQSYSDLVDKTKQTTEAALLLAVANAPVSVALCGSCVGFSSYKKGILRAKDCGTIWSTKDQAVNHAVLVVGYGTENGTDYWIIKNSWNYTWGESGYIRLERGTNACLILNQPPMVVTVKAVLSIPNRRFAPIPTPAPTPRPVPSCGLHYPVIRGDTLADIARRFNVPLLSLLFANPLIANPSILRPGFQPIIPCSTGASVGQCMGDVTFDENSTLADIADAYDVTLQDLINVNPQITNPNFVLAGEVINIPPCEGLNPTDALAAGEAVRVQCENTSYVAQPGDSLAIIAGQFNINVAQLMYDNPELQSGPLIAGETYNVKSCPATQDLPFTLSTACAQIITASGTDDVTDLALEYNVSISSLMIANYYPSPDSVPQSGAFVCIPN